MKHQRPRLRPSALHWLPLIVAIISAIGLVWHGHGVEDPDGLELGAQQVRDGQQWERERQAEEKRRALVETAEAAQ